MTSWTIEIDKFHFIENCRFEQKSSTKAVRRRLVVRTKSVRTFSTMLVTIRLPQNLLAVKLDKTNDFKRAAYGSFSKRGKEKKWRDSTEDSRSKRCNTVVSKEARRESGHSRLEWTRCVGFFSEILCTKFFPVGRWVERFDEIKKSLNQETY